DINATAASGKCCATVKLPTATDNCSTATVTCKNASGTVVNNTTCFPQGSTAVTCTAVDSCGNSKSISFNVIVETPISCVAGPLTIGFWQNKNGQGIITSCGGTGTAPSPIAAYLTGFNPFKDLSSTASSSAVATYVYNVIKAANASGSSMNAMLKAQML